MNNNKKKKKKQKAKVKSLKLAELILKIILGHLAIGSTHPLLSPRPMRLLSVHLLIIGIIIILPSVRSLLRLPFEIRNLLLLVRNPRIAPPQLSNALLTVHLCVEERIVIIARSIH